MKLERHIVDEVAELASLSLTEEERTRLQEQLGVILEHVAKLQELHTDDVPPSPHAVELTNVMRGDDSLPSLSHEALSRFSPSMTRGYFKVPKILGAESE